MAVFIRFLSEMSTTVLISRHQSRRPAESRRSESWTLRGTRPIRAGLAPPDWPDVYLSIRNYSMNEPMRPRRGRRRAYREPSLVGAFPNLKCFWHPLMISSLTQNLRASYRSVFQIESLQCGPANDTRIHSLDRARLNTTSCTTYPAFRVRIQGAIENNPNIGS